MSGFLSRIFGARAPHHPLTTRPLPIADLPTPAELLFAVAPGNAMSMPTYAKKGEELSPGHAVGDAIGGPIRALPVAGKVARIANIPDIRGGKAMRAVVVEPSAETSPRAFEPLDPKSASVEALTARLGEAGVMTGAVRPQRLLDLLCPKSDVAAETLVVLAADREPLVSASARLFTDRKDEAPRAARMLGRISGARRVALAVLPGQVAEARAAAVSEGVEIIELGADYPSSLEPVVARRAGGGDVRVVPLEAALAAWDAVCEGRIQDRKVVTVIGADGQPMGNFRVPIGARISHVFSHLGLEPQELDKVVAGGPMQGFSQYSLDGIVDAGVDALMLIRSGSQPEWTDAPCINCGTCIDVCPVSLQVQLIGRYSEFGLFDRTQELGIEHCIECGLCAAACSARRPVLQLLRLAKRELDAAAAKTASQSSTEDVEEAAERRSAA